MTKLDISKTTLTVFFWLVRRCQRPGETRIRSVGQPMSIFLDGKIVIKLVTYPQSGLS